MKLSSKKVEKAEKKVGEPESLRKALTLEGTVEVINSLRAGFVKGVSLAILLHHTQELPLCVRKQNKLIQY